MYHGIIFYILVQPKPYISGWLVCSTHGHCLFYYHTGLAKLHFSEKITHGICLLHCSKDSYFETLIAVIQIMEIMQRGNFWNSLSRMKPCLSFLDLSHSSYYFTVKTVIEVLERGKFVPGIKSSIIFHISTSVFSNST